MPIQQFAYDIPDDIAIGLMKGIYKRFGGVVRDASTGAIVKHLKEVEVPKKTEAKGILKIVKSHPVAAACIGTAAVVGAGVTAYTVAKKQEKDYKRNSPPCIIAFEKTLKNYLKAVRKGELKEKHIDELILRIDNIKELGDEEQISLNLSSKELKQLVSMIYDYTRKLAKVNDVKIAKFKQNSTDPMDDLRNYLTVQKEIFNAA